MSLKKIVKTEDKPEYVYVEEIHALEIYRADEWYYVVRVNQFWPIVLVDNKLYQDQQLPQSPEDKIAMDEFYKDEANVFKEWPKETKRIPYIFLYGKKNTSLETLVKTLIKENNI